MCFEGREWEERIELDQVEGREKTCTLRQVRNSDKTAYIIDLTKQYFPSIYMVFPGHGLDLLYTCLYADDIFYAISNSHIKKSKFGGKSDKFGRYSKIKLDPAVFMGLAFSNSRDP